MNVWTVGLLNILRDFDTTQFREVVDAGSDVSDIEIVEAMHRARLACPGINRAQRENSKQWLAKRSNGSE